MKPNRLLSILRTSLFCCEWLAVILAVMLLATAFILLPYIVGTPGLTFDLPVYRLKFDLQPSMPPLAYHGTSRGTVVLENVQGDLIVQDSDNPGALLKFVRWRAASGCLFLILGGAIFSLLRRLCDNVRRGDAFSLRSVRYIRGIGWCCLAYCAVGSLVSSALDTLIGSDLRQHLAVGRIRTDFVSADVAGGINFFFNQYHLNLDLTTLGIALFAFVFAAVFRQGVLLREDSALTV